MPIERPDSEEVGEWIAGGWIIIMAVGLVSFLGYLAVDWAMSSDVSAALAEFGTALVFTVAAILAVTALAVPIGYAAHVVPGKVRRWLDN